MWVTQIKEAFAKKNGYQNGNKNKNGNRNQTGIQIRMGTENDNDTMCHPIAIYRVGVNEVQCAPLMHYLPHPSEFSWQNSFTSFSVLK